MRDTLARAAAWVLEFREDGSVDAAVEAAARAGVSGPVHAVWDLVDVAACAVAQELVHASLDPENYLPDLVREAQVTSKVMADVLDADTLAPVCGLESPWELVEEDHISEAEGAVYGALERLVVEFARLVADEFGLDSIKGEA